MTDVKIRQAEEADIPAVMKLRRLLWPDIDTAKDTVEIQQALATGAIANLPYEIFVADADDDTLIGFLEVDLRSHADGCDTTRPVGYVEGWFVSESYRGRGVGKALMRAAENWAQGHGCHEMASDALIENVGSQRAHVVMGFEVVDRCVHYRKALRADS